MEAKTGNPKTEEQRLREFIENPANQAALEPFCKRIIQLTQALDVWSILTMARHIQAILDQSAAELERPIVNKN